MYYCLLNIYIGIAKLTMEILGKYKNREVIWIEYSKLLKNQMPSSNWICLLTSSINKPNIENFDKFTRASIKNGILEFKGHGRYGEILHDWFDETMLIMNIMENHPEMDIMTTWHNKESFADAFWQCFFATCLPDTADYKSLKIICSDLDGTNRINELRKYIHKFEQGWLPKD